MKKKYVFLLNCFQNLVSECKLTWLVKISCKNYKYSNVAPPKSLLISLIFYSKLIICYHLNNYLMQAD